MSFARSLPRLGATLLVLASAACAGGTPIDAFPSPPVDRLIRSVAANGGPVVTPVLQTAPTPTETAGAPTLTTTAIGAVINGGSAPITVTSTQAMTRLFVTASGYDGYWEVPLPSGTTTQNLVLTMADTLPSSQVRILVRAEINGQVTPAALSNFRTVRVGSGDVQVSVAWTGASDVDLYTTSPQGDRVFFGNTRGASGGALDLDSNAACSIDNVNNENIVWPRNAAPRGTYRVEVALFSQCNAPRTDWVVTAVVRGQTPRIASGSFTGPTGSSVAAAEVMTFTY